MAFIITTDIFWTKCALISKVGGDKTLLYIQARSEMKSPSKLYRPALATVWMRLCSFEQTYCAGQMRTYVFEVGFGWIEATM